MTDSLPSTDALLAEAVEIVAEFQRQSLTLTEMARLCDLPGRIPLLKALRESTAKSVKPEIVQALRAGFVQFMDGYTGYRKVRSTRPAVEAVKPPSDARPQPRMLRDDSVLVRRLRDKNREAAA